MNSYIGTVAPLDLMRDARTSKKSNRHVGPKALTNEQVDELVDRLQLFVTDTQTLIDELRRARWEAAGFQTRLERALADQQDLEGRYWRLQMEKVPGGPV